MKPRSEAMDDLPDKCEYGDCTEQPTYRTKFKDPEDYVYYCGEHAFVRAQDDNFVKSIRL